MSSSDATNLALGILGVLTMIPAIASLIKNRLPYARLRYFDELVAETDGFLFSLEEQGIFRKSSTVTHFRARLAMCVVHRNYVDIPLLKTLCRVRREAERPRMETYCAASIWQQVRGLFNGLSKKLSELSSSALSLRAEISVSLSFRYLKTGSELFSSHDPRRPLHQKISPWLLTKSSRHRRIALTPGTIHFEVRLVVTSTSASISRLTQNIQVSSPNALAYLLNPPFWVKVPARLSAVHLHLASLLAPLIYSANILSPDPPHHPTYPISVISRLSLRTLGNDTSPNRASAATSATSQPASSLCPV